MKNRYPYFTHKFFGTALAVCALMTIFAACEKNDPAPEEIPEPTEIPEENFNRLIRVSNFGESLPAGSEPTTSQAPIYFSLEQNGAVNQSYAKTDRWDISFSGIYRSFVGVNNGTAESSFGYKGPGKGGILLLEEKFEDVTNVPSDGEMKQRKYGTDDSGAFGSGLGWYLYDFGGDIMADGSYDKQHIAYPIENRTLIIRTSNGNYAKMRILSVYKDRLDPEQWKREDPAPFLTFEYVLVKAGSKTFEITK